MVNHSETTTIWEKYRMFPTTLRKFKLAKREFVIHSSKGRLQLRKQKGMRTKQQSIWKNPWHLLFKAVYVVQALNPLEAQPQRCKGFTKSPQKWKGISSCKVVDAERCQEISDHCGQALLIPGTNVCFDLVCVGTRQVKLKLSMHTCSGPMTFLHLPYPACLPPSHQEGGPTGSQELAILMRPRPNSSSSITMSPWELPTLGPRMDEGPFVLFVESEAFIKTSCHLCDVLLMSCWWLHTAEVYHSPWNMLVGRPSCFLGRPVFRGYVSSSGGYNRYQ